MPPKKKRTSSPVKSTTGASKKQKTSKTSTPSAALIKKFHDAVEDGDVTKVKAMHKESASLLTSTNSDGDIPLILACDKGNVAMVRLLLKLGPDTNVDWQGMGGQTALHAACSHKGEDFRRICVMLAFHGADPLIGDDNGRSPLKLIIPEDEYEDGDLQMYKVFLEDLDPELIEESGTKKVMGEMVPIHGEDFYFNWNVISITDGCGPALRAFCREGDLEHADLILSAIERYDNDNYSLLDWAAENLTPFIIDAAHGGNTEIVRRLVVDLNVNVNAVEEDLHTALHCASDKAMIDCLISLGADETAFNYMGHDYKNREIGDRELSSLDSGPVGKLPKEQRTLPTMVRHIKTHLASRANDPSEMSSIRLCTSVKEILEIASQRLGLPSVAGMSTEIDSLAAVANRICDKYDGVKVKKEKNVERKKTLSSAVNFIREQCDISEDVKSIPNVLKKACELVDLAYDGDVSLIKMADKVCERIGGGGA